MNALHPPSGDQPPARLLLVDAEFGPAHTLIVELGRRGHQVVTAATGDEALALLRAARYDLMIVDVALPDASGTEVMRTARQLHPDLVIIVHTAQPTAESAIAAVKVNAADYLVKPCNPRDLILAVSRYLQERANQAHRQHLLSMVSETMEVLRQLDGSTVLQPAAPATAATPDAHSPALRVGPLTLDREKRQAVVDGNPPLTSELTEGEVAVLMTLMEQPDRVLSCDQLAGTLGYHDIDRWTAESIVRSCVFRLRQKIEAAPDSPRLLCTVRGRGYFFRPPEHAADAPRARRLAHDTSYRDAKSLAGILPS